MLIYSAEQGLSKLRNDEYQDVMKLIKVSYRVHTGKFEVSSRTFQELFRHLTKSLTFSI